MHSRDFDKPDDGQKRNSCESRWNWTHANSIESIFLYKQNRCYPSRDLNGLMRLENKSRYVTARIVYALLKPIKISDLQNTRFFKPLVIVLELFMKQMYCYSRAASTWAARGADSPTEVSETIGAFTRPSFRFSNFPWFKLF